MVRLKAMGRVTPKQIKQSVERQKLDELMEHLEATLFEDLELLSPQERVKLYADLSKHVIPRGCGATEGGMRKPTTDTERVRGLFAKLYNNTNEENQ